MNDESSAPFDDRITRLQDLLARHEGQRHPPVHEWNPPRRGDIGLRILADGTWLYRGSAIRRQRLVKLFASVMRRDTDGHHYLVTPVEMVPIAVDDAPFVAVEMEVSASGTGQLIVMRTNVDDIVKCGADHALSFARGQARGGTVPYVHVRDGLEARLTRSVYYELAELAVPHLLAGVQHYGVWSSGEFFAMALTEEVSGTP